MKYGFLFGAGAEAAYGLPSGGKFALEIFRHDTVKSKEAFKNSRDNVDTHTTYANDWLPEGFNDKNISTFGKTVFQNIIKDTVEQRRGSIISQLNNFDDLARKVARSFQKSNKKDIVEIIERNLNTSIDNARMGQDVVFIDEFQRGNALFSNTFFCALLLLYKKSGFYNIENRVEMGKIILSILQLQIGALSEELSRKINDSIFKKKDDSIDLFDDLGEIIQLNYSATGLAGLEYLLEPKHIDMNTDENYVLAFARELMEDLYAAVLDYKSLIDSNWRYLYYPKSDWAKFSKICIFLYTVRDYIASCAEGINQNNPNGYYNMLKKAVDEGKYELSGVATTNYNQFIQEILQYDVSYLNGSTEIWYDPYVNKMGSKESLDTNEHHILVPLMFTQSGTKPMTSIDMSMVYVDTYKKWKQSDAIVVVGFGFGVDDEHINGILRTLIDSDNKKVIVVTLASYEEDGKIIKGICRKLKVANSSNVELIKVDYSGIVSGTDKKWTDYLA